MHLQEAFRVCTFVPPDRVDVVLAAVLKQTPLTYGPYDKSAWWSAPGIEQFEPRPGAAPTVGQVGKTERVPTVRLEFVIPKNTALLERVLEDMLAEHPWQEPATFIDPILITVSNPVSDELDGEGASSTSVERDQTS